MIFEEKEFIYGRHKLKDYLSVDLGEDMIYFMGGEKTGGKQISHYI